MHQSDKETNKLRFIWICKLSASADFH